MPLCEVVQYTDLAQFLVWVLTTSRCFQNPWDIARSPSFICLEIAYFVHKFGEKMVLFSLNLRKTISNFYSRSPKRLSWPLQDKKLKNCLWISEGLSPTVIGQGVFWSPCDARTHIPKTEETYVKNLFSMWSRTLVLILARTFILQIIF